MFTRKEKNILYDPYFEVIRETEQFIEVRSANTGHCWSVFKIIEKSIDNTLLNRVLYEQERERICHMKRTFIELPIFRSRWKAMGLNDDDLARLQRELLEDPKIGPVMQGTGGVRKMRFAFEDRGKSGSARVIYVDFEVYDKIYLITAYPKNEKDNLTKEERNELRQLMDILKKQLEGE